MGADDERVLLSPALASAITFFVGRSSLRVDVNACTVAARRAASTSSAPSA